MWLPVSVLEQFGTADCWIFFLHAFLSTVFKPHVKAIMSYRIVIRLFSNPFLSIFSTSTEPDYICQM